MAFKKKKSSIRGEVQVSKHTQNFTIVYYFSTTIQFHIWVIAPSLIFFCTSIFPSGILNMVFPSTLTQLSSNSFPTLEFHQICCLKGTHLTRLPASSPQWNFHLTWLSNVFPYVTFLLVHLFSVTFADFSPKGLSLQQCAIKFQLQ